VADDYLVASYSGAEFGVQFMHERGVMLLDDPGGPHGSTVVETLNGLFNQVDWRVSQIEHAERMDLAQQST
jgi:hypothetical protein